MKIAIIGPGNVGGTLGRILTQKGHEIVGVRGPQSSKVQSAVDTTGGKALAASVQEAASHGELLILATPGNATQEAIASSGNLTGKIIIDATNPIEMTPAGLAAGLTSATLLPPLKKLLNGHQKRWLLKLLTTLAQAVLKICSLARKQQLLLFAETI